MINSLKTIAVFGCQLTSRYRQGLCAALNEAAEMYGVNLVYFNALGNIGEKYAQYGKYEFDIIKYIDLKPYDGIIFDGEGYNVEGLAERIIEKLRGAERPVVSITSKVEGFYNIEYDDAFGIRALTEHFIKDHHFTKIGFMAGYLTHEDAKIRLNEFRTVMKENGLPEDGAGLFEGDFWFFKGEQAADYFLSLEERPEAIICSNDYMAISLITAMKKRGVR
ncbi:MAG: substrate-binding domain-containing protein, partial [Ruminococcus flavefaciens]